MAWQYIDLFSGIGGFHIGLEMAGFEFDWVAFSEIEDYPEKVYKKHFPNAKFIGDITKIDGTKYTGEIDIITGGFPCQDISYAGKGAGIHGSRSGLWKEMFRLICEIRPRFVIVENVPALLARGLGVVLGDLAQGGYDAEWDCISAQDVGANHKRKRVWIVAYPNGIRRGFCGKFKGTYKNAQQGREDMADSDIKGLEIGQKPENGSGDLRKERTAIGKGSIEICNTTINGLPDWAGGEVGQPCPLTQFERPNGREVEYDFCGVAHGVSHRVDRLKCLGNAVVPQVVAWIGQRLLEATNG